MGVGLRKARAKAFKQKTDKAVADEIRQDSLFSSKLVESELTVECFHEPEDAPVEVGDKAKLVDMQEKIEVFVRMRTVGYVIPSQTASLRSMLKLEQRRGRSVQARVIDVSELTPTFSVVFEN